MSPCVDRPLSGAQERQVSLQASDDRPVTNTTYGNGRCRARPAACRSPATSASGGGIRSKLITDAARRGDVVRLELPGDTFLLTHPRT